MGIICYLLSAEIIIFLTKMDFNQVDIQQFLRESMPLHFREQSPLVFEAFVRYMFEVDGFTILPLDPIPEMAGMIMAEKDLEIHLIHPVHSRTEKDIPLSTLEKVSGLVEDTDSTHGWVITNSTFSSESKSFAESAGLDLWEWDDLYKAVGDLFFEGRDPEEAMAPEESLTVPQEIEPYLRLKAKWEATEGVSTKWYNLSLVISNPTDRNIYLHLDLPALIDTKQNQTMADQWGKGEFVAGMLYGGASIRTNALFATGKLGERPPGGRIVLTCHERSERPVTYHLNARLQGQACFVVTYCYTTQSPEYAFLTRFRDEQLSVNLLGRLFIRFYYAVSSRIVGHAPAYPWLDRIVRKMGTAMVPLAIRMIRAFKIASSKTHP